jgi:hypothetical protein
MPLAYVRKAYGVPAKRGGRIIYDGDGGIAKVGTIMSASGAYLRVHFEGEPRLRRHTLHPTWHVKYLTPPAA